MESGDQSSRPARPTALVEYVPDSNVNDTRGVLPSAGAGSGTRSALSSARSTTSRPVLVSSPDKSEIAVLLECPVCYDIMIPPIVSCSKGHNVCSDCRARIRHCPVCREMYAPGNLRNLLAEQLSIKCQILCKFTNSGCSAVNAGNALRNHQAVCSYRSLTCPDCDSIVAYDQFLQHIQDHDVRQIPQSEYSTGYEIQETDFNSPPQKWELTWLFCHNSNFLCHTEKHESCWSFWISCAENNDELDDYLCEIILWNKEKRNEVKYRGPINSVRTKAKDVLANASGLIMPKDTIRAYVSRGGVDLVFRIIQAQYEIPRIARNNNVFQAIEEQTPMAALPAAPERENASPGMDQLPAVQPQSHREPAPDNEFSLSDDFESLSGSSEAGDGDGGAVARHSQGHGTNTRRQLMRFEVHGGNGGVRRVIGVSVLPRTTSDASQPAPAAAEAPNEGGNGVGAGAGESTEVQTQTFQTSANAATSPRSGPAASNNHNQQPSATNQLNPRLSPRLDANVNANGGPSSSASSPASTPQDRRPGRPPPQPPNQNNRNNPLIGVPASSGSFSASRIGTGGGRWRGYGRGRNPSTQRGSPIQEVVENGY